MDAKIFERLYKEIRREYLKKLVTSEQLFIRPDHLAGRTRWLATELLKKIGRFYESDVEFMKNVVRKRLRELPFGTKHYESLSDFKRKIFFLLVVKCPLVARDIGEEVGKLVLKVKK